MPGWNILGQNLPTKPGSVNIFMCALEEEHCEVESGQINFHHVLNV